MISLFLLTCTCAKPSVIYSDDIFAEAPGKYEGLFPVILNDNYDKPYQYLHVVAELKAPKLWFDPLAIVLTPVPLATEVSSEFTLFAAQFKK